MTGRTVNHGIRIAAALALLVAVMTSPIRPSRLSGTSPRPNHLLRNFGIAKPRAPQRPGTMALPSIGQARVIGADLEDELEVDIEDELWATLPPPRASSDILPSPSPGPQHMPADPGVAAVIRPLRC